jgi:uncharacterized protein YrrD
MDAGTTEGGLGRPIAYLALAEGAPVFDAHGERIGVVDEVDADERADVFHGVLVHTRPLPGRHLYAGADQIAGLYERGVLLAVGADALSPPPERPRPAYRPEESRLTTTAENPLEAGLRRAWDWITRR